MAKTPAKAAPAKGAKAADKAAAQAGGAGGGRLKNSLVPLKLKALSTDVGPRVVAALFGADTKIAEYAAGIHDLKERNRAQLSEFTLAILKAARFDDSIDLAAAFSGDEKAWGRTLTQIRVATGLAEVRPGDLDRQGKPTEAVFKTAAVKDFLPMPGESEKNCPNFERKKTFEKNFTTQLKLCARAASGMLDLNIEAKYDKAAATLVITGPEVKKHFGQDRVVLNEKQMVGTGDGAIKLAEKPSFTALANMGAKAAGAGTVPAGSAGNNTRGSAPGTIAGAQASSAVSAVTAQQAGKLAPEKALIAICDSLKKSLEGFKGEMSEAVEDALTECANAIDAFVNKNAE